MEVNPYDGSMLAAVLTAPEKIRLDSMAMAKPGSGHAHVRLEGGGVRASGLEPWSGRSGRSGAF